MFRGGSTLAGSFSDSIPLPLAMSWRHTAAYAAAASYNPASPAIVDGVVYMTSGNRIVAVDAVTGALKWRYPQDETMASAVRTAPAVSDGLVIFGSAEGKMYAVDVQTRRLAWTFDSQSSITASPTVADGVVYFGTADGRLWALAVRTGVQVTAWKGGVRAPDELAGTPAVSNGVVYVLTTDQMLYGIAASTAKTRTSVRLESSVVRQCPIVRGELVYVAAGPMVMCLRASNLGARRWARSLPADVAVAPVVSEGGVYVVSSEGRIYALDPLTGRPKWKTFPQLDLDVVAPPVVSGSTLIVGTVQGGLYGYDAETGALKWTYIIAASTTDPQSVMRYTNVSAAPVVSDGRVYVFTDDASVSCFSASAVDTTVPTVTELEPEPGIVINGNPPIHFRARLSDYGSGLNVDTIRLFLDDEPILKKTPADSQGETKPGFTFDRMDSLLEYDSPTTAAAAAQRNLPDGRHVMRLLASDWKGNTVERLWSFSVDNTLKKLIGGRARLPRDTGGYGYTGRPGAGGGRGPSGSMGSDY